MNLSDVSAAPSRNFVASARRSRWVIMFLAIVAVVFGLAQRAEARRASFGEDDTLHEIAPTKDPQYKLGYRTSIYFVIAGCYVKDMGYVLIDTSKSKTYVQLDEKLIAELQADGTLPNPLPPYKLSLWDYLLGYSLWIIIAVVVGISVLKKLFAGKQSPEPVSPAPAV